MVDNDDQGFSVTTYRVYSVLTVSPAGNAGECDAVDLRAALPNNNSPFELVS